jgi:hypothetical protein
VLCKLLILNRILLFQKPRNLTFLLSFNRFVHRLGIVESISSTMPHPPDSIALQALENIDVFSHRKAGNMAIVESRHVADPGSRASHEFCPARFTRQCRLPQMVGTREASFDTASKSEANHLYE